MKQIIIRQVLLAAVILLSAAACDKDETENPNPPQQELPNPLPANALVKQLKWSDTDRQTLTYNAKGQVTQLKSQWQFEQGDPNEIKVITYDFQYDGQDRPILVTETGGLTTRYSYQDNLVDKVQEFYAGTIVMKDITYQYDAHRRITGQIWKVAGIPGGPVTSYKYVFSYDAKGNLTKLEKFEQADNQQYELVETTQYSEFDDKINPTSWLTQAPYLPQARFQYNNPQKVVRTVTGDQPEVITFRYEYNAEDLPTVRRIKKAGGVTTQQYQY